MLIATKSEHSLLGGGAALALLLGSSLLGIGGCSRDVRLAEQDLRDVTVGTVTHYGVTLDEQATPKDVTHVLLRAIRADFLAKDEASRREAINVQKDLCAADAIYRRSAPALSRAEAIHHAVYRWTPIVSHYISSIDIDRADIEERFAQKGPTAVKGEDLMASQVLMELDDPSGDPNARVVLAVDLVQEKNHWRVLRLSFPPRRSIRKLAAKSATQPAELSASSGS